MWMRWNKVKGVHQINKRSSLENMLILYAGSQTSQLISPEPISSVISPTVLPPSADCRQQQPSLSSQSLSVMETDNTLDMCFS